MTLVRLFKMNVIMRKEIKCPTPSLATTLFAIRQTPSLENQSRNPPHPAIQLHDDFSKHGVSRREQSDLPICGETTALFGEIVDLDRLFGKVGNGKDKFVAVDMR
jgi:hypothetical protein